MPSCCRAYLRFVRGVVDSEDMPLNISREMLQNNPQVAQIRKAVTSRVLERTEEMRRRRCSRRFEKIWQAFGPVIKEGLYEDMERRDELFEIVRFTTTQGIAGVAEGLCLAPAGQTRRRSTI